MYRKTGMLVDRDFVEWSSELFVFNRTSSEIVQSSRSDPRWNETNVWQYGHGHLLFPPVVDESRPLENAKYGTRSFHFRFDNYFHPKLRPLTLRVRFCAFTRVLASMSFHFHIRTYIHYTWRIDGRMFDVWLVLTLAVPIVVLVAKKAENAFDETNHGERGEAILSRWWQYGAVDLWSQFHRSFCLFFLTIDLLFVVYFSINWSTICSTNNILVYVM